MIKEMLRHGMIMKNGTNHSPNTVYKLVSTSYNGNANGATAQINLNLTNRVVEKAPEERVEEKVYDDTDSSELPF